MTDIEKNFAKFIYVDGRQVLIYKTFDPHDKERHNYKIGVIMNFASNEVKTSLSFFSEAARDRAYEDLNEKQTAHLVSLAKTPGYHIYDPENLN
jgi:hypothetical protein